MNGSLPYLREFRVILGVALLNLALAFAFQFGRPIYAESVLIDAAICGAVTSIVNVLYGAWAIRGMRKRGELPAVVPESRLMKRLPKSVAPLAAVFAVAFAALMTGVAFVAIRFFDITTFTFARFAVWKVVYSAILSAKVLEMVILRLVQPDCAAASDPPQRGAQTVKNPLPKRDTWRNLFNTVVNDFGFNMCVGLLLGGVVIVDNNVVIPPTTRSGILVGGLILGLIVTLRMVVPVFKQVSGLRDAGQLPPLPKRGAILSRLPQKPLALAMTLALPVMVVTAVVLWAALTFFGFETLNFFQYFVVRTIYVSLLSKPIVAFAVLRYRQPRADAPANARPVEPAALGD